MGIAAVNTATTALGAQTERLNTVSDNLAQSETVAAKEKDVHFIGRVTGLGLNTGTYSPGSVSAKALQYVDQAGSMHSTQNETDLAFDTAGGFFVVSKDQEGTEILYTRDGSFVPDKEGFLRNQAGFYLMGWETDELGEIDPSINTSIIEDLVPLNMNEVSGQSRETTEATLRVNLPSDVDSTFPLGKEYNVNMTVYDSLGSGHNLVLTWERTSVSPALWNLSISGADASTITKNTLAGDAYGGATPMVVEFDDNGYPLTFDGGPTPPDIFVDWNDASTNAGNNTVRLDLGTVGSTDAITSKAGDFNPSVNNNDGRRFATLSNTYVDEKGFVSAVFRNGETLITSRIAVVNFASPNNLNPQSGNAYSATDQSGSYVLGFANTAGNAKIVSGQLESSKIDVSKQLTRLIDVQHAYVANTKIITTADEMLRALLQTK